MITPYEREKRIQEVKKAFLQASATEVAYERFLEDIRQPDSHGRWGKMFKRFLSPSELFNLQENYKQVLKIVKRPLASHRAPQMKAALYQVECMRAALGAVKDYWRSTEHRLRQHSQGQVDLKVLHDQSLELKREETALERSKLADREKTRQAWRDKTEKKE